LEILYEWNLYDVIDAWIVATADRVGTSGVADHRCVGEIANHDQMPTMPTTHGRTTRNSCAL